MRRIGTTASPSRPARFARILLALALFAAALAWPLLDIGPKGPLLATFPIGGGIDTRDLLSLPVLVLIVALLWPLLRRPRHPKKSGHPKR